MAEPFAAPPFHDGFLVSPLNTVVKRDSNERRVIVDLSWPCGSLVYDGIPFGYFLRELLESIYPTIDAIASAIALLGWGCMLYKRDLRKAHCQFPIYPYDYHLLGYTWNGQFYFDTVLTMGLRSAACLQLLGFSTGADLKYLIISMTLLVLPHRQRSRNHCAELGPM